MSHRVVYAALFQVDGDQILEINEAGFSEEAWKRLGVAEGDPVTARHAPALPSMASMRRRIYGNRLDETAMQEIVKDVVAGRYTDVHLAAFLTAGSAS